MTSTGRCCTLTNETDTTADLVVLELADRPARPVFRFDTADHPADVIVPPHTRAKGGGANCGSESVRSTWAGSGPPTTGDLVNSRCPRR